MGKSLQEMLEAIVKEASTAFCAVVFFCLPTSCLIAALKGGIVTDFGCWFWIEVDGLRAVRRHQLRAMFANF